MIRATWLLGIGSCIIAACSFPVMAQSTNCSEALVRNYSSVNSNSAVSFAMASLAKTAKSFDKNIAGNVTLPTQIGPVPVGGRYAQKNFEDFTSQTGISWDENTSLQLIASTLSEQAVQSYRDCLNSNKNWGVKVFLFRATSDQIQVAISWIAPPGASTSTKDVYIDVTGGTEIGDRFKKRVSWNNSEKLAATFNRNRGEDFRLNAMIGGDSELQFAPKIPIIETSIQRNDQVIAAPNGDPFRLATDSAGRNQGPVSECRSAPAGWTIDTNSVYSPDVVLRVGPLDSSTYVKYTEVSETRICWEAFLRPLAARQGGDLKWFIRYPIMRTHYHVRY